LKIENSDLLADYNNILNICKKYFSHLFNIHNISDIRQREIHTAEPPVPGLSHLEVQTATAKLKKHKSSDSDQISAELIQAGGETLVSTNSLIQLEIRKNCLISGRSLLLYQFTRCVIKLTVISVIILGYNCYQLHAETY
jgi:hypothetical protein